MSRTNNPGTYRLQRASAHGGGDVAKAKEWTEAERQAKREIAERLDLGRHLRHGYHGPRWTKAERALLGKLPDIEVAARIGHTVSAVRQKRNLAGIRTARDGRQRAKLRRQGIRIENDSV